MTLNPDGVGEDRGGVQASSADDAARAIASLGFREFGGRHRFARLFAESRRAMSSSPRKRGSSRDAAMSAGSNGTSHPVVWTRAGNKATIPARQRRQQRA
jgi:hypothetical protein